MLVRPDSNIVIVLLGPPNTTSLENRDGCIAVVIKCCLPIRHRRSIMDTEPQSISLPPLPTQAQLQGGKLCPESHVRRANLTASTDLVPDV